MNICSHYINFNLRLLSMAEADTTKIKPCRPTSTPSTSTPDDYSSKMKSDSTLHQKAIPIPDPPNSKFKQINRTEAGLTFRNGVNSMISMLEDVKRSSLYSYDKNVWPAHKLEQVLCRIHAGLDDTHEILKLCNSTHYYEFKIPAKVPKIPEDEDF